MTLELGVFNDHDTSVNTNYVGSPDDVIEASEEAKALYDSQSRLFVEASVDMAEVMSALYRIAILSERGELVTPDELAELDELELEFAEFLIAPEDDPEQLD